MFCAPIYIVEIYSLAVSRANQAAAFERISLSSLSWRFLRRRWVKGLLALRQLLRRAPSADQLDHLATEFRGGVSSSPLWTP